MTSSSLCSQESVRGKKERIALYAPFGRKNSRRESFIRMCSLVLFVVTYTLEAKRCGEWVTCDFWPVAEGKKVQVTWSWSRSNPEVLTAEQARNLWRGLLRKGWAVEKATVNF